MNGCAWDSPILLDGGWRVFNGQVPHKDFYTYLGDLPYYLISLAMKLKGPGMGAIECGSIFLMWGLVLAALAILRRRTSASLGFLFALFIALLVVTPRPLGDPYDYTDHAMVYNRYGEACIALFGMLMFLWPRPGFGGGRMNWLESAGAGLLLVLLLGCKLNYFAAAIGFFGVAWLTKRLSTMQAAGILISATLFFAIALALTKIPLAAMANDYRIMLGCQSSGTKLRAFAVQGVKSIFFLPILLALVWEGFLPSAESGGFRRLPWRDIFIVLAIFGAATFLISSNSQIGQMPLLALAALYGAEMILRQPTSPGDEPYFTVVRHLGAFSIALLFLFPLIVLDVKTDRYVTFAAVSKRAVSPDFLQSTQLKDFRFVPDGTRSEEIAVYKRQLDEGLQLLRRHPEAVQRLDILLFSDPYHLALGLAPPLGGIICVSPPGINQRSHPSLARLLGSATHLLTEAGSKDLKEAYGSEWDALNLKVIEETKSFTLYALPAPRE